jgi:hypothetical protein
MKRLVAFALCFMLLCAGCGEKNPAATEFHENSKLMVGTWHMTEYTQFNGQQYDFSEEQVLFTYRADGTGEKTVKSQVEYTFTFSYDGEHLYTTAAYPNGRVNLMKDVCKIDGEKMSVVSYDEQATIRFEKVK